MPSNILDSYGMNLTTASPLAAESLREGVITLLSQNGDTEEKFDEVVALDDGFAFGHGLQAFWRMQRARPAEAKESAERAQALASDCTRRERQQIEAICLWVNGKGPQSIVMIKEHLSEFPRDAVLVRLAHRLYMLGCSGAGVPNFPPEYLALLRGMESKCSEDWAFLAEYAFAHHENGLLSESRRLAEKSLELNPTNAVACHSATHVYFEEGEASSGEDFLGTWLDRFDCPATSYVHLSWHLALFELALGKYQGALDRYEEYIRPSVTAKSLATLNDSASLLWRLQIYGGTPPPKPGEEVRELAAPAAERSGAAFRDAHAALAFAGSGDEEAISKMIARLEVDAEKGNLLAREMVLPMTRGIHAFGQGDYTESVRYMEPLFPQLARIGGSHAQREVFEDTLLEAYLRAEQFEKARDMLNVRLKQRDSVRDTFWLGRVQVGQGDTDQAQTSLVAASQAWLGIDPESPEIANLERLAASVS